MTSDTAQPVRGMTGLLAWLLCVATFGLIGVGGLITTTDAGMAVPDWPGTYGYNLFLYPWQTWVFGPWDLFVEHGHRLLATAIGLLTIVLLAATWLAPSAERLRPLALLALGLVIFQGVLGGMRVLANERLLAMAHGVTGPVFFAVTCLIAARLRPLVVGSKGRRGEYAGFVAVITTIAVLTQLALGAGLRHIPETADPWTFASLVKFHLIGAVVVAVLALLLAGLATLFGAGGRPSVRVAGLLLGVALLLQITAGGGAWVLKYGLPGWAQAGGLATMGANTAGDAWQTLVVTAHQMGGSLLLGLSVFIAGRSRPLDRGSEPADPSTETGTLLP